MKAAGFRSNPVGSFMAGAHNTGPTVNVIVLVTVVDPAFMVNTAEKTVLDVLVVVVSI